MADASTITGFVDGQGFDFNKLITSVGSNVQTWALQSLNQQVNKDTDGYPKVPVPSVLAESTTSSKIVDFLKGNWIILLGVGVAGWFVWKKM